MLINIVFAGVVVVVDVNIVFVMVVHFVVDVNFCCCCGGGGAVIDVVGIIVVIDVNIIFVFVVSSGAYAVVVIVVAVAVVFQG